MRKLVFLHIPKTAGQTVHSELSRIVGAENTSPVRVHTQADADGQFPDGYGLYSGHLDWDKLNEVTGDRFVFTILRDPLERIASFYFYLRHKSLSLTDTTLNAPENTGLRKISQCSVDDYFFGGDSAWQRFILDHYDNFYCSYFATRKIRGSCELEQISKSETLRRAENGASQIDRIYTIDDLQPFEEDLHRLTGQVVNVTSTRINVGPQAANTLRWPVLLDQVESDLHQRRLEDFAILDQELMSRIAHKGIAR